MQSNINWDTLEFVNELTAVVEAYGSVYCFEFTSSLEADAFEIQEPNFDAGGFGHYANGDPFAGDIIDE